MKFRPVRHSDNIRHHFQSDTDNVSTITDAMVRLAAKLTEAYAGDIIYAANRLLKFVEDQKELHVLLAFGETHVNSYNVVDGLVNRDPGGLQLWRLHHIPASETYGNTCTVFERVYLRQAPEVDDSGGDS